LSLALFDTRADLIEQMNAFEQQQGHQGYCCHIARTNLSCIRPLIRATNEKIWRFKLMIHSIQIGIIPYRPTISELEPSME